MESFDSFSPNVEPSVINPPVRPKVTSSQEITSPAESSRILPKTETIETASTTPSEINTHQDATSEGVISPEQSPLFPQLTHVPIDAPQHDKERETDEDEDIEVSGSFNRRSSPSPAVFQRNREAFVTTVAEEGAATMHKFVLHETQNFYYVLGSDMSEKCHRILKIDRTAEPGELNIIEDEIVYTKRELQQTINAIDEGNRATGGLRLKAQFWGILGFVRFTGPYYMIIVTKRTQKACIGGHYVYEIEGTEMIPLVTAAASRVRSEKQLEEARYASIFSILDLNRYFYFSTAYDVTRTLQHNMIRHREALQEGLAQPISTDHNDMFVWNTHLLEPARSAMKNPFDWCLAIIHGYVDQIKYMVYSRVVTVAIIARRSRFFAGARFLKRGANDLGYVANDVETEHIVQDALTTSFHQPGPKLFANSNCTSYTQHRGSIPLYWTQDNSGVTPKPDIHLSVSDPFYSAAALHFDDLFRRYGTPIHALNLVKQKERVPREGKLLKEYENALSYLNQFLPEDKRIQYEAFDMSRITKAKDRNVVAELEEIAEKILPTTGFFRNAASEEDGLRLQHGVVRMNCIDCLDRTNAAQFVIAKKALGLQLQALGVTDNSHLQFDTDCVSMFTEFWQSHGDAIASQYGGSQLVNTMSTYRKTNQWTSQSRDFVESFKRFYNNSFLDSQRQEAYNLFLGTYTYEQDKPMLWEMSTDYYLHHTNPRSMFGRRRPSYRLWYTPEHLEDVKMPLYTWPAELSGQPLRFFDDYFAEYYKPLHIQQFRKMLAYKMLSNFTKVNKDHNKEAQGGRWDLSPFTVRVKNAADAKTDENGQAKKPKGVKVIAPSEETASVMSKDSSIDSRLVIGNLLDKPSNPQALGDWIESQHQAHHARKLYTGIIKDSSWEKASLTPMVPQMPAKNAPVVIKPLTKQEKQIQAFEKLVHDSLQPTVDEVNEYQRYVEHPQNIPLVVSSDIDPSKTPKQFLDYLARVRDDSALEGDKLYFYDPEQGATTMTLDERAEQSLEDYQDHIDTGSKEDPLTVTEEDHPQKRYKAYRQWLRGKSLFKQRFVVDGEVV